VSHSSKSESGVYPITCVTCGSKASLHSINGVDNLRSLLFCLDEKVTGVMIQLLAQIDASVQHETEVFPAVSRLASEHFDFLIIDCENEQTGRLVLKGARHSPLNKITPAVAVVDGKTSAEAFRFGADFVLTKPVAIGQATKVLLAVENQIRRGQASPAKAKAMAAAAAAGSGFATKLESSTPATSNFESEPAESYDDASSDLTVDGTAEPLRGKDYFAIVSSALLLIAGLAGWLFGSHRGKPDWVSWIIGLFRRIIS
jgi:DNA-binding response OmpR family regulator